MAKKVKPERGSKSNAVRAYLKDNPKARLQDVVDVLKTQGIGVSGALVNSIKYSKKTPSRKKRRKVSRAAAKISNGRSAVPSSDSISVHALIEAKKIADRFGGIEELQKVVAALAKLHQ